MKMTTHIKQKEIQPCWHLIDAKNKVLGRLATEVASILRGKHKVTWSPHIDNGDFVVLINADQVYVSGKKQKNQNVLFSFSLYWFFKREKNG